MSIYFRPFLWEFLDYLKANKSWLEVVIFTTGVKTYTDLLLKELDPEESIFESKKRVYQEDCDRLEIKEEHVDLLVKDLQLLNRDLKQVIYLDSHPFGYWIYPDNCVPVLNYLPEINTHQDTVLQDILHLLQDIHL